MTGEKEDTDVGFPGPEHHIAERALPMRVAMAVLGVLALVAGYLQLPGVTSAVEHFLEPTFAGSALFEEHPSVGTSYLGLLIGALIALAGIALAWHCYVRQPGVTLAWRERFRGLHDFLERRWYFDELLDALVYRPVIATGRLANNALERVLADGVVATAVGVVRGVGVLVRGAQSGFVRAYALLVIGGFAALALYFLVVSS